MRFKSRAIPVGKVWVGGDNPIRIQSMTTTPTDQVEETIEQIIQLADHGCDIARVTVQGRKEALACEAIKNGLLERGYDIPLVADIHFYPPAAMLVADFVDKVRVNPGNFVDRRATFKTIEYSDQSYREELEKIEEKFAPLVLKCQDQGKSIRIGCNHGSLSDRILNRYGDTPRGMVESAFEFARVARKYDFHNFIFSMKASNTHVMIEAYRLLVNEMVKMGWDYPLHLGVTEAGEGEDGRVRSAIGIGSLLLDGIGDTIRVSLTEDPWREIAPCKELAALGEKYRHMGQLGEKQPKFCRSNESIGLHRDGAVFLDMGRGEIEDVDSQTPYPRPMTLKQFQQDAAKELFSSPKKRWIALSGDEDLEAIKGLNPELIFWQPIGRRIEKSRGFFASLRDANIESPVILNFAYSEAWDEMVIRASAELGSLLCDGMGEGILINGDYDREALRDLSFNILQGSRKRTVKTEFISCPSCGRTLFNLQEVAARIRSKTSHLAGVKIAIMGCIVNGPGEMADADFGYVGSRPGKIDLYVGKECVERNIDFDEADDRLIALIKAHGRWSEPQRCSVNV